ncbi:hypothetical protein Trydic_g23156 [Trypoxylus dichotomus]
MASRTIDDLSEEELITVVKGAMDLLKSKFKSNVVDNIADDFELPRKTSWKSQEKLDVNETQNIPLTPNPYASLDVEMDAQETKEAPEPDVEAVAGPSRPPPTRKHSEKPKSGKIAPIFLKDKDKWTSANRLITSAKINTTKCNSTESQKIIICSLLRKTLYYTSALWWTTKSSSLHLKTFCRSIRLLCETKRRMRSWRRAYTPAPPPKKCATN